jgi:TonB family protein
MSRALKPAAAALIGLTMLAHPGAMAAAESASAAAPGPAVERPDWVRKPTGRDLLAVYPPSNAMNARGGTGTISCLVTTQGAVERCKVAAEDPVGSGFGASALLLAPSFRMRPMMVDGKPVGGAEVKIPVHFAAMTGLPGERIQVLTAPPWRSTPTREQVAAVYPQGSASQLDRGHVALRCKLTRDGKLANCDVVDGAAKGRGFEAAARRLLPLFEVAVDEKDGKLPGNIYVSLAIDLPNPNRPLPPVQILQPNWLTAPEPEAVKAAFPQKARDAKVASGRAVLDCKADHAGFLVDCAVSEETPAGLGFGAAAMALVGKLRVNPWTVAGSPSDGAIVRLPLRITDDSAQPAPARAVD